MTNFQEKLDRAIRGRKVSAVELETCDYWVLERDHEITRAIRQNAVNLGWEEKDRGAFGNVVPKGSRVIVKPNLVMHKNRGNGGILPLITHQAIIKTVVAEVLKADPEQVSVGDAPIQSCEFDYLLRITGLGEWAAKLQSNDSRFKGINDYRRTTCAFVDGVRLADEERLPEERFVRFNLGTESMLEPLTDDSNSFRVTCYDPRLMAKTHSAGNHQYLVAKEVIESDVVINLPKLKTHKKAGITNALKNLVGINGNKEFLPHHRIGGADRGGDCYPGSDLAKTTWEFLADRQNMTTSPVKEKLLAAVNKQFERLMKLQGDEIGVEGAWSGNQTVPLMTIDLNRILLYGKADTTLCDTIQRRVIHISDAVVAGQGDGPLSPDELPLNLIMAADNASALDWAAAHLLGYDGWRIPLLTQAFSGFRWGITNFVPDEIELVGDWKIRTAKDLLGFARAQNVTHPVGWRSSSA